MQTWEELLSWTYSGVNFSLAGNGGPECVALVPGMQKIVETVFVVVLNSLQLWMVFPKLRLGKQPPMTTAESGGEVGRRIFLLVMCLTFGVELGFKFASQQMIWILNPCHIVTMIQIFLLAAPPSPFAAALFRLHVHWLGGATIALVFPVLNTRMLPFEVQIYFLQHILMLVIPLYLTRLGVYAVEPLRDFSWSTAASAIFFVYHFVPLQLIAVVRILSVQLRSVKSKVF